MGTEKDDAGLVRDVIAIIEAHHLKHFGTDRVDALRRLLSPQLREWQGIERWKLAEAIFDGHKGEAWKDHPNLPHELAKFPRTAKARRGFLHHPAADVDLALASADAVLKLLSAAPPIQEEGK